MPTLGGGSATTACEGALSRHVLLREATLAAACCNTFPQLSPEGNLQLPQGDRAGWRDGKRVGRGAYPPMQRDGQEAL